MAKLITLSLISLSSLFIAVCGGMMYSQGYPMMYGYGGGMGGGGMGMGMGGGIMSFFTFIIVLIIISSIFGFNGNKGGGILG